MKLISAILIYLIFSMSLIASGDGTKKEKPSPDQAIERLKEGNTRFVNEELTHSHLDKARMKLAGSSNQGDYAFGTVLSCADSRVPVEAIFDAGIMDLFVIRVAGNVMGTHETGTIEYGLAHVYTPVLVVMGHTQCGAVTAVVNSIEGNGTELERNIPALVEGIIPAAQRAMAAHPNKHGADIVPYAIEENVWQGITDLFMDSPTSRLFVNEGKIKIVGAIYDVGTGEINWLPEAKVDKILKKVEQNSERAMNIMAE